MSEIRGSSGKGRIAGRIAAGVLIGMLVFVVSWVALFKFMTASAVGAGSVIVIVALGTFWDSFDSVLDTIGGTVMGFFEGIFGAICNCLDT